MAKPTPVAGLSDAVDLWVTNSWSCAVRTSGKVSCWGTPNLYPQIGEPHLVVAAPTDLPGIEDAVAVAIRQESASNLATVACVVHKSGAASCTSEDPRKPTWPVAAIHDAVAVAAGVHHLCFLLRSGQVRCLGSNEYRQLGSKDPVGSDGQVVAGVSDAVEIGAGRFFTCVRRAPKP